MSRGTPDYGIPDYNVAIEQNDLSILSVVNSGFTFMDGKGRIVWYDNFIEGLAKWSASGSSGGSVPRHFQANGYSYSYFGSILLDCAVNGGVSLISTSQNISFAERVGVEVYVRLTGNHGEFTIRLYECPIDDVQYQALLFVNVTDGDLYLTTTTGNVKIYDMPSNSYFTDHWTNIKLVANYQTGYYYRAVVGGTSIDISAYQMTSTVFGIKGKVGVDLRNTGKAGGQIGQCYIGGVIITVDEP